jgi:sugar (pentulose or hexulose) kinase
MSGRDAGQDSKSGADADSGPARNPEAWLLGVDAGLTATKAGLFAPDGTEAAVAARETPAADTAPHRSEVDLAALWEAVAGAIREVIADGPTAPDGIEAVGVAGHGHGLYLLDDAGEPVRPGIRSTDSRATDLVAEWEAAGLVETMRERLGYEPFAADPLSLLGWLARHEPAAYERIDRILFCKDYLKYRLTGRVCTDEMEGSVFADPEGAPGRPATDAFEALGLADVAGAVPGVVPSREACGTVTAAAAEATGLPVGTPVASGLHDVGAVALGSGAYHPGQGVLIVGTWGQSIVVAEEPKPERAAGTDGDDGASPGLARRYLDGWLRYKGNRSAAACVDWFVGECGGDWERRAAEADRDPYAVYNDAVESVPPGSEGLLFHPYLHGSTDDPTARGGFYGLTADHTKAHMLRAIYEGVAIAQVERLAELEPAGGLAEVRLGGGGARSEVWSEMFADVRDGPVLVPAGEEAGARGAAMCAGMAVDRFPDPESAVSRMASVARRHDPDPGPAAVYRERRAVFEDALAAVRPTWERLTAGGGEVDTDG